MGVLNSYQRDQLDRWITASDSDHGASPRCPECGARCLEGDTVTFCARCDWREAVSCEDDDEDTTAAMPPLFCADCGGECEWDAGDNVWRCRSCDTPHEHTGEPIRFGGDGRELR